MFKLDAFEALLKVQSRTEKEGTDEVPAGTLHITLNGSNDLLDNLEKGLRAMYYKKPTKSELDEMDMDLVEQSEADLKELIKLRSVNLKDAIKHAWQGAGYRVVIGGGLTDATDINLIKCELKGFSYTLNEGGTVEMKFNINCHPNRDDAGDLWMRNGKQVELTLEPPSLEDQAQQRLDNAA